MKKVLLSVVLFTLVAVASLFAWEAEDLKLYPSCTKEGDWMLNFGAGISAHTFTAFGDGYIYIPPIHVSLDRNVALGSDKLPFFLGGSLGYWGHGYKDEWYYSALSPAFRIGYHFNWGVDKLDTYAVAVTGWTLYLGDTDQVGGLTIGKIGFPNIGINLGVRWFLTDLFGFWAETGGGTYFNASIGLAFKF